ADERSVLGTGNQSRPRLEHHHARALGAYQRASHVETVLGQQLIEVIARHAPRDVGKLCADQVCVVVLYRTKSAVDVSSTAPRVDDGLTLAIGSRTNREPRSVIQQNRELIDVVNRLAGK